jgi:hypothetical protein
MNTELPPDDTKTGPLLGLGSSAVLGPSVPQPESAADEVARLVDKCNRYIVDNARLAENVDRLRAALALAAPALELGCDALRSEAERYHAEMKGHRPWRHKQVDDDYTRADLAWQAVVAALGPNVRANAAPRP